MYVGGRSRDMDRIMEMARRHGLYIIEDASHAHGSNGKVEELELSVMQDPSVSKQQKI